MPKIWSRHCWRFRFVDIIMPSRLSRISPASVSISVRGFFCRLPLQDGARQCRELLLNLASCNISYASVVDRACISPCQDGRAPMAHWRYWPPVAASSAAIADALLAIRLVAPRFSILFFAHGLYRLARRLSSVSPHVAHWRLGRCRLAGSSPGFLWLAGAPDLLVCWVARARDFFMRKKDADYCRVAYQMPSR